jgi:hypothetical protein
MRGSTFNIVLVDPLNSCDTIVVGSVVRLCDFADHSDPGACHSGNAQIPQYYLDFSYTEFTPGFTPTGNINTDNFSLCGDRIKPVVICPTNTGAWK